MQPVIVVGAGGHAKVLIDALLKADIPVEGLLDQDPSRHGTEVLGRPILGDDSFLDSRVPGSVNLVNGIGGGEIPGFRQDLFGRFCGRGFRFVAVIHPDAVIGAEVVLGDGCQVLAGAVINPGTTIGENTVINTGARIDHDCRIGAHVHVAPAATLAGGVEVEDRAFVGAGACVIQGRRIGTGALVGAGSVVIRDVAAGSVVVGVPGTEVGK